MSDVNTNEGARSEHLGQGYGVPPPEREGLKPLAYMEDGASAPAGMHYASGTGRPVRTDS